MTIYVLRVHLLPHPWYFEGDREVWRDIEVDDSHTLADLHETIFEAFDRWEDHLYEFIVYNKYDLPDRSYVHPFQYDGSPSWRAMSPEEIEHELDQLEPADFPDEAIETHREARSDPPQEGNAADTTIEDLGLEPGRAMNYIFDHGDNWEHYIEVRTVRDGSRDESPTVVEASGEAPEQYPDLDE